MFNSYNEIMQANREGREFGATEERRRVHYAAMLVPIKTPDEFSDYTSDEAAVATIAWNDCRFALLTAIGVKA